jgi:hypothetical protein
MNRPSPWLFEAPPRTTPSKDRIVEGSITRIIVVPYRRNFNEFRQEVRKALGRYTMFRSDRGANLDRLLNSEPTFLQSIQMLHSGKLPPVTESSPIEVMATFIYLPGFKKVTRITFP